MYVYSEYLQVEASLKAMRNAQNDKRVHRDKLVKELANMRSDDESYRGDLSSIKMQESQVSLGMSCSSTRTRSRTPST